MNGHSLLPLVAGFLLVTVSGCGAGPRAPEVDLDAVLRVTTDSLLEMDVATPSEGRLSVDGTTVLEPDEDETNRLLSGFADVLETNYNAAEPALFPASEISVVPRDDASFVAVADTDADGEPDEGEPALWAIEIDGENARILATDGSGAVQQSGFSGTGLLAGYFLASMLTRQRAAGVDTRALANRRTVTPAQAARARAGSGSFSRGK